MRGVHPAIAELKRRNRAAGRRLSPIERHPTSNNNNNNNNNNSRTSSLARRTSSATPSRASTINPNLQNNNNNNISSHLSRDSGQRSGLVSRFMSTAPVEGSSEARKNSNNNNNINSVGGRLPAPPSQTLRRVPTKPQSSVHAKINNGAPRRRKTSPVGESNLIHDAKFISSSAATPSVIPNSRNSTAAPSPLVPNDNYFKSNQQKQKQLEEFFSYNNGIASDDFNHHSDENKNVEEDNNSNNDIESIDGYNDVSSWNRNLPENITNILNGEKLENPFTTELWTKTQRGEIQRINGYYACIRCHVPLVSPAYQVSYILRGIAAFSKLNRRAVEVRIGGLTSSKNSKNSLVNKSDSLQLQIRCRCCNGFLGIITPDSEGENIFVVNSCCLEFIKEGQTRCRLDGSCDAEEYDDKNNKKDGEEIGEELESMEIDFSDPDIFELS